MAGTSGLHGGGSRTMAWSNDAALLPPQRESIVGRAAQALQSKKVTVPVPLGMDRMAVPMEQFRLASHLQIRLVQDAHAACNRVTVLESDLNLEQLMRAEQAEIEAAAQGVKPLDKTLPARATSVAVLVNPVTTPNATAVLDAVAHLARAPSTDEERRRAVESTRVAFLAGATARSYAARHAPRAVRTRSSSVKGGSELCLTWAEVRASEDENGEVWCLRSEFAELPYCDSTSGYAEKIQALVHCLWATSDLLPESTRLLSSYALNEPPEGAYVRSVVDCADNFWALMHLHGQSRFSQFVLENETYAGLEFTHKFVKLVPKHREGQPEIPPDHKAVYHGLLIHQKGKEAECKEFCVSIRREEESRAHAAQRRPGLFGLRPAMTSAEEVVCMHVLFVTAGTVTFGTAATSYGLLASPGHRLHGQGPGIPQLTYRILPVDRELIDQAYLLPCTKDACFRVGPTLFDPAFNALNEQVKEYAHVFGLEQPDDSDVQKRRDRERVDYPETTEEHRPPTEEERQTGLLLGVPLGYPAFCVGDVYNVLSAEKLAPSVCRFLLAAASKFGSAASVEAVFDSTREALVEGDRIVGAYEETVCSLKRKLAESELRVEVLERNSTAKSARSPKTPAAGQGAPAAARGNKKENAAPSVADSVTAMAENAESVDEENGDEQPAHGLSGAVTTGTMTCHAAAMHKLLKVALKRTVAGVTESQLRTNFRSGDVRVVCRALENDLNAESLVLTDSTQAWAIARFRQMMPAVPSVLTALSSIFAHGIKSFLDRYEFKPGREWTNPILLWFAKNESVRTYMIDANGTPRIVSPLLLLDVDTSRTSVAYWKEDSQSLGFATSAKSSSK